MKTLSLFLLYGFAIVIDADKYNGEQKGNQVSKNGMEVSWEYKNQDIRFNLVAPTKGWVAIGFNTKQEMTDCYLLMGRVKNGSVEVIEHYTKSPGDYLPIKELGVESQILPNLEGREENGVTSITFSLPKKAVSKYQRDLFPDSEYVMVMAYSQDDNFQHHSLMRTSVKVKL